MLLGHHLDIKQNPLMKNSPPHTPLYRWLVNHGKVTFLLLSLSFISFGAISLNLVSYFAANANYILTYRWQALMDGGIEQFLVLWLKAFLALGCYLCFKLCEHALIDRMAHDHDHDGVAPVAKPGTNPVPPADKA